MDLKNYLKTSGVRQQEFAVLVGETQGYVSRVASGNGSVIQQILPTFYVNRLQQQFSKYFSSLQIALADVDPPVYNISAITNSGSKIVAQVYV